MADSKALTDLHEGLVAVDDVLGFAKTGAGKPKKRERSLFVASVSLSYAMWENYVEEVAVEVTEILSRNVDPADVPETVRKQITKQHPSPWELVVHPGWRALWLAEVENHAKGDPDGQRGFGINTANEANVRKLFELVGVDPFSGILKEDIEKVEELVSQRGQIVHTGKAPSDFYKENATGWRTFVAELAEKVDRAVADGAVPLIGATAW